MAFGPAVALAALLLEDDDLVTALLFHHLGGHHGAGDRGAAGGRGTLAAQQQNLGELDDVAGVSGDLLDLDNVVRRHAILLAARANDREHDSNPSLGACFASAFSQPARL